MLCECCLAAAAAVVIASRGGNSIMRKLYDLEKIFVKNKKINYRSMKGSGAARNQNNQFGLFV